MLTEVVQSDSFTMILLIPVLAVVCLTMVTGTLESACKVQYCLCICFIFNCLSCLETYRYSVRLKLIDKEVAGYCAAEQHP